MISKELLTAIREDNYTVVDIDYFYEIGDKKIGYLLDNKQWYYINIYELDHKCKEWAFDKGYTIVNGIGRLGEEVCYILQITRFSLDSYYEQGINYETPINACQWILDKDSK